ncbi:MAG TPA: sigma 54-interacting transcriptional regulator [Bryocella sp.]|nr:sigma 54-interacting transcriptional regulator [Bryocella sp.]
MTPLIQVLPVTPIRPGNFAPQPKSAEARPDAQLLVGPSPAMARLWAQLRILAPHFRVALLTGEAGCGAEAVAQALHDLSCFAGTPLIHLRAAEAERQLRRPTSLLGTATRGALFLSDVDRLSAAGQQMLLRLLRLRRHRRIAIIASTSADLRSLMSAGTFDGELFSHLSSLRLQIPSVRERVEDIPLLTHQLIQAEATRRERRIPSFEPGFLTAVTEYAWPGNFQQMRPAIAWMVEHSEASVGPADLAASIAEVRTEPAPEAPVRMVPLDEVVHEHVRAVLIGCNGNKLRAAEVLGISRSTLYRMLEATAVSGGSGSLALLAS